MIPTNCKYYLRNDTIAFEPNEIRFLDAPIFDIHNQKGIVSGALHHKYLKDLSYDLGVKADNLLAYDFREFGGRRGHTRQKRRGEHRHQHYP